MHGIRQCERTLEVLPNWFQEFVFEGSCFSLLACADLDEIVVRIEVLHDKHQAAHDRKDRARWKAWVDKSFERGAIAAHRFTRLQAVQEIVAAGAEQSPHELADR